MKVRSVIVVGVLASALALPLRARSAATEPLPATLRLEADRVVASFSVMTAFTEGFRSRVAGGLDSRVEIETWLLDREGEEVGRGRRSCKLRYSVWDEQVYLSVEDEGRTQPTVSIFAEIGPALDACAVTRDLPVALRGALVLQDGYRLDVRVALNPVSEELVERSRQFISNPRGGARGGSDTVLGAVAGLFSRRGGPLGDVLTYRSPPLVRPRPAIPVAQTSTMTSSVVATGVRTATATGASP